MSGGINRDAFEAHRAELECLIDVEFQFIPLRTTGTMPRLLWNGHFTWSPNLAIQTTGSVTELFRSQTVRQSTGVPISAQSQKNCASSSRRFRHPWLPGLPMVSAFFHQA